jgi:UDP-GlcNAc:undecaprenyl-phosphate GlcNAc-1-phosphate transferase
MILPALLLVVFLVSILTSLAVAGRLTTVAVRGRLPEGSRQSSSSGIPRIGGVAVFAALALAILAAVAAKSSLSGRIAGLPHIADEIILSAAILFVVGLLDDVRGVKPLAKLGAQTVAALIICSAGFTVEQVSLMPGYTIELGLFALPVTILWLVGVSNAFNLIDGMDGLAGGVAIIGLITVAIAGLLLGNPTVPIYTVGLVGALLGFLRYNWPSARLFMGDSGSLVVGYLVAVLAVKGATDSRDVTYGLIPIFALAYPLLDTGVSILRRWLRGVPLSRADRRHVHHQLRSLGLGPKKALLMIYAASTAVGAAGLLVTFAPPDVTVVATMIGVGGLVVVIAAGVYWLQYHEFLEAGASLASAARKSRSVIQDRINARDIAKIIAHAETVDEVQAVLQDNASTFRFAYMKLTDPESRRKMPGRITQELQALRLWKLEYPILQGDSEAYDGLCLTIYCALETTQRPAGAERVAQILAPAIGEWARHARYLVREHGFADTVVPIKDAEVGIVLTAEDRRALARVRWDERTETTLEA